MPHARAIALNLERRPNRRPIWPCCRNQNETVALFYEVNAWPWCLLAEPIPLLGTTSFPLLPKKQIGTDVSGVVLSLFSSGFTWVGDCLLELRAEVEALFDLERCTTVSSGQKRS